MIVDDEQDLCDILQFNLTSAGYEANAVYSAEDALRLNLTDYHLLLLDVMMEKMSGFELADVLKQNPKTARIPIIFLSAKDTENDKLEGFSLGADDYIAKPFSLKEVLARIKSVLHRTAEKPEATPDVLVYEGLVMNLTNKTVHVDGERVPFTKTEFELLRLLLNEREQVFSRQQLIERVWPQNVIVTNRTVDVNITRIRKKVGRYAANIVTRLGFGYYFEASKLIKKINDEKVDRGAKDVS